MPDFILNRNHRLISLTGHTIQFVKGEPVSVPPALKAEAIAIGAQPVDGDTDVLDEEKVVVELTAEERTEALIKAFKVLQERNERGGWILKWRNIQRIDQPRIHLGWDLVELPYIGLKIKDYDAFLTLITPRLAVRLLTEQRAVLMQAMRSERSDCPTGGCGSGLLGEGLLEESRFCSPSGQRYEGVIAMLGNRMARLRDLLGYDLLVPDNSLDRSPEDFVHLLQQYQRESNLIQIN